MGFESQQEQEISFLQNVRTNCGAHPASYLTSTRILSYKSSQGIKLVTCHHLMPGLRKWSCNSATLLCLHVSDRQNFIFQFYEKKCYTT